MARADLVDILLYSWDEEFGTSVQSAADEDHLIRRAENQERLMAALHDFAPDLLLAHAPTAADLDALAGLKESKRLPPAIALVSEPNLADQAFMNRLLELGMGQFICLPVEPDELLRRVAQYFRENPRPVNPLHTRRLFRAGEPIFLENEIGSECYRIISGRVRICRVIDRVTLQEIAELGPGSYFGEMALLGSPRRSGAALAIDDVVVNVTTRDGFARVARDDPAFGVHLIKMLTERLKDVESRTHKPPAAAPTQEAPLRGQERDGAIRVFTPGTPLFEPGERAPFCYIVLTGSVKKHGVEALPGDTQAGLIGIGEAVGDVPFLANLVHTHRVVAHEETSCFLVNKETMREAVRRYPEIYFKMAQGLAAMVQAKLDKITRSQVRELS